MGQNILMSQCPDKRAKKKHLKAASSFFGLTTWLELKRRNFKPDASTASGEGGKQKTGETQTQEWEWLKVITCLTSARGSAAQDSRWHRFIVFSDPPAGWIFSSVSLISRTVTPVRGYRSLRPLCRVNKSKSDSNKCIQMVSSLQIQNPAHWLQPQQIIDKVSWRKTLNCQLL